MILELFNVIDSIPPEYTLEKASSKLITYTYKERKIWIAFFENGNLDRVIYYDNESLSRPFFEGPAIQSWHKNGQPRICSYMNRGDYHRPWLEGPARQSWYDNGVPSGVFYCQNGKLHRPVAEGPAKITWGPDSKIFDCLYFVDGVKIDR